MSREEEKPYLSRRELREARERETAQPLATPQEERRPDSLPTDSATVEAQVEVEPESAVETTGRIRRVADTPVDAVPERGERSSQTRARDRARRRELRELEAKEEALAKAAPQSRRERRKSEHDAESAAVQPGVTAGVNLVGGPVRVAAPDQSEYARRVQAMSEDEVQDERQHFEEDAREFFEDLSHKPVPPGGEPDPKILAEQVAMAERAAILNQRAAKKQELERQASSAAQPATQAIPVPVTPMTEGLPRVTAPATAVNLMAITPEVAESVPGLGQQVIRTATSQIAVAMPKRAPKVGAGKAPAGTAQPQTAESVASPVASPVEGTSRAELLAKAAALAEPGADAPAAPVATPQPRQTEVVAPKVGETAAGAAGVVPQEARGAVPVAAGSERVRAMDAHGLTPIDTAPKSVADALRIRLVQWGILGAGVVALIVGISLALANGH